MPRQRNRGVASNQQPQMPQPQLQHLNPNHFVDGDAMFWYHDHYDNAMVIEKLIDEEIDDELVLSDEFDNIRWGGLVQLHGYYYPNLVKQFYANMPKQLPASDLTINTWVKGQRITLVATDFHHLLNFEPKQLHANYHPSHIMSSDSWTRYEALGWFDVPLVSTPQGFLEIKEKYMEVRDRMFVYLIHHNVLPRRISLHTANLFDLYVADKLSHGLGALERLSPAPFIPKSIWDVVSPFSQKSLFFQFLSPHI